MKIRNFIFIGLLVLGFVFFTEKTMAEDFNCQSEYDYCVRTNTALEIDVKKCEEKRGVCLGNLKESGLQKGVEKMGAAPKSFEQVVGGTINIILSVIGLLFLVLTVYGGFIWFLARGEEAEVKKGQGILTMAVIGLFVVLAAYAISYFIFNNLYKAAGLTI